LRLPLNRRGEQRVANAVIADPEQSTSVSADGASRSVQAADVELPLSELESVWSPLYLERLARTYWHYLSRVTLGLVRMRYTQDERALVLIRAPLTLLRFHVPEYELEPDHGVVRWRIRDGLLVARPDHGHILIDVRKEPPERPGYGRVRVQVEVANFYPMLATLRIRWLYAETQSRIHVFVTHGFLRSLAKLEFAESPIGRFEPHDPDSPPPPAITVGNTPTGVVTGLAVAFGAGAAWLLARHRKG
jgi:hypothetical protein